MKLSFMLTLCAGVAVTTPVGARQGLQKLPFFKPGNRNDLHLCGTNFDVWNERSSERCVGTIKYCENENWRMFHEKFDSVDECFQSREPAPKRPFKLPADSRQGHLCHGSPLHDNNKGASEDCVGTIKYCETQNWQKFDEKFDSVDECFQSREPAPKPTKLPFKVNKTGNPRVCGPVDSAADFDKKYSEDCVGTIEYCKEENWWEFGEKFESEDECLQSREPAPSPEKLPFKVDSKGNLRICMPHYPTRGIEWSSEDCVGTIKYCERQNWRKFGEKFESEDECLESRNPAPGAEARSLPATQ